MEEILKYFPNLSEEQISQFQKLEALYQDWNAKINVISRKDIDELYLKHVLHSLAIAKVQPFEPGTYVLDVGTGGGFPGIPLAILFPETRFYLIDVIAKKIKVVQAVAEGLGLKNVKAEQLRANLVKGDFDFIVSRAVTNMPDFVSWIKDKIKKKNKQTIAKGIFKLKGCHFKRELEAFPKTKENKTGIYCKDIEGKRSSPVTFKLFCVAYKYNKPPSKRNKALTPTRITLNTSMFFWESLRFLTLIFFCIIS